MLRLLPRHILHPRNQSVRAVGIHPKGRFAHYLRGGLRVHNYPYRRVSLLFVPFTGELFMVPSWESSLLASLSGLEGECLFEVSTLGTTFLTVSPAFGMSVLRLSSGL